MTLQIVLAENPVAAEREAILKSLVAYNDSRAGASGFKAIALLLQDQATGEKVGGLWASSFYNWLYIELLFVPESLRGSGFGSELVRRAEMIAIARDCVGVWLDTFGFQALGFYQKLGYEMFGALEDHPRGSRRCFLRKLLASGGSGTPPAASVIL
jgi:GNAT superfamily N-acetyltransferase